MTSDAPSPDEPTPGDTTPAPEPSGSRSTLKLPITAWLALVAFLAFVASLIAGTVVDGQWGSVARNVGAPFFALAFGGLAADAYYRKEGERKVQEKVRLAAYTTLNVQYALAVTSDPLRRAIESAYELDSQALVGDLRAAEMAVHLAYGTSQQAIHELDALAVDDSVTEAVKRRFEADRSAIDPLRPRVVEGNNPRPAVDETTETPETEEREQ